MLVGMDDVMGLVPGAVAYPVSMDAKRRPTLSAALLSDAHIRPDEDLIAVPVGEGAILLHTRAAALTRARESIRAGFTTPVAEGAVERFQQDRRADHQRNDETFKRRARETSDPEATGRAAERGAALLAKLGL